jgi:HEAT repeat protein
MANNPRTKAPDDLGALLLDAPEMDEAVRAYAAALGDKARTLVLAAIDGRIADPTPVRRRRAIDMLGALGWPDAGKRLIALLADQDRGARLHAISSLGHIGGSEIAARLLAALDEPDHGETEKAHMLRVLGEIGDIGTAQAIEAWASRGRSFLLRHRAREALAAIRAAQPDADQAQLPY